MLIAILNEQAAGEPRAAMIPANVARLIQRGASVRVEAGTGIAAGFTDQDFIQAGAAITADRAGLLADADLVLRVRKPSADEVDRLKPGGLHVSFLDPFTERDLVAQLAARRVSAISLELIPRTTRAQKMDALSSQANLAGYVAVILAAEQSPKIFPMMMTPAGTIAPARVLVIGAGVAGLQAIATARRLGARVEAYDTRPVVEEQVRSLGARFLKIDLGETGQTKDGYAKALTEAQLKKQREAMQKFCALADVVITTAQVFGRRAPILVTAEMLAAMSPGSVVVDGAVESGGNVAGAVAGRITERNGVKIVALPNLPGRVPIHASQMLSNNLTALIETFWDAETKRFGLRLEDEIIQGCLVTHAGAIRDERFKS